MKNHLLREAVKLLRRLKRRFDRLEEKADNTGAILHRNVFVDETSKVDEFRMPQALPIDAKQLWQGGTLQYGEKRIMVDESDWGRIKQLDGEAQYSKDAYNYGEYQ